MSWQYWLAIVMCAVLVILVGFTFIMQVNASELDEPEALEVSESTSIMQDEQQEAAEPSSMGAAETSEDMQSEQSEDETVVIEIPESFDELVQPPAERYIEIQPFASGVIVGQLADLLQENVIENDGYTEESWQRYENAMSAGWNVIGNFMAYTNDEVQAVIDELTAAIAGLEYPAGHLPNVPGLDGLEGLDAIARECVAYFGFLGGLLAVLVFSGGMRNAT